MSNIVVCDNVGPSSLKHIFASFYRVINVHQTNVQGTGFVKVGFAGENFPRFIFPSLVGRPILRAEEAVAEGVVLKNIMVCIVLNLFMHLVSK